MEKWINILATNCDPTREDEYNHWYDQIHIPDILKTPGFVRARRFLNREFRDGRGSLNRPNFGFAVRRYVLWKQISEHRA